MGTRLFKLFFLAMVVVSGTLAGDVFAQATSATVNVSAVVPKACRFYSAPGAMTIQHGGGLIDPTSASNATGSSTINYRCTNGVSPRFDIDASGTFASPKTRTVSLAGTAVPANTVAADITVTATGGAGTGLGGGQDKTATIDGSITPANFAAASPDTYSKTVTVAIEAIP
jgi:hypothetical protein